MVSEKCSANENQSVLRGRIAIFTAGVLWSTSGFFAQAPWFDGWPAETRGLLLAFFRSLFALLVLLPLVRRPQFRWAMLPMSIGFAVMVWSFMNAMVYGPAANAIWLQYLAPAWVLIGSVVLMGETVERADRRMFAFCFAGVAFMIAMEFRQGGNLYASALAVLSGISFACVVLSMRTMKDVDSAWLITLNHGATVVLLLPWALASHQWISAGSYLALGLFAVFQISLPYVMFANGLRKVKSAEASMLILIEPVLVPVWVFLAWKDDPSYRAQPWWTYVGGGLILAGLVGRYLPSAIRRVRKIPNEISSDSNTG